MTHWFGPKKDTSGGNGHPVMFGDPMPAQHFEPFPDGGGYPIGFLEWAFALMNADPARVLHLCSGSVTTGVRVDIRRERNPDIIADCRNVPLPDESFDWILADPPYSEDYATNLYGTGDHYPLPGQIAAEACRLLRPGGLFGLMHFQVPMLRKPMRIVNVYGITTGAGYAIRAWTLCRKQPESLALFGGEP
jgi:SAM-dependent methyltransferase